MKQNKLKQKWQDSGGETLVEVLVSILIGALAVFLLFGAVVVSVNLDRKARAADKALKESIMGAENRTNEAEETVVPTSKIIIKNGSGSSASVNVIFYGDERALSYKLNSPPAESTPAGGEGGG